MGSEGVTGSVGVVISVCFSEGALGSSWVMFCLGGINSGAHEAMMVIARDGMMKNPRDMKEVKPMKDARGKYWL